MVVSIKWGALMYQTKPLLSLEFWVDVDPSNILDRNNIPRSLPSAPK